MTFVPSTAICLKCVVPCFSKDQYLGETIPCVTRVTRLQNSIDLKLSSLNSVTWHNTCCLLQNEGPRNKYYKVWEHFTLKWTEIVKV